jgi:hypothetical protein
MNLRILPLVLFWLQLKDLLLDWSLLALFADWPLLALFAD